MIFAGQLANAIDMIALGLLLVGQQRVKKVLAILLGRRHRLEVTALQPAAGDVRGNLVVFVEAIVALWFGEGRIDDRVFDEYGRHGEYPCCLNIGRGIGVTFSRRTAMGAGDVSWARLGDWPK